MIPQRKGTLSAPDSVHTPPSLPLPAILKDG
jgi:hypothetical protein